MNNLTQRQHSSFRTMYCDVVPVGHSLKLPGHTTMTTPADQQKPDSLGQIGNIGPEDSISEISKASTLLSEILKAFDKELHNK